MDGSEIMALQLSDSSKKVLMAELAKNLPVFRAKLGITQIELAQRVGITRQTLNSIESGKREMSWITFVALTLLFDKNEETKALLSIINIYTNELNDFLMFNKREGKDL